MNYSTVLEKLTAAAVSMCIITSGATITLTLSADLAWANNGNGNGNGRGSADRSSTRGNDRSESRSSNAGNNGNGNGNGNSSQSNGNSGNKGRAISRELASVNASLATPNALANARSGTVSGQLRDYRDTFRGLISAVEQQNVAYAEFVRLSEMSESQILGTYPNGGHAKALADATSLYTALRHNAATAQSQNQATLQRLTGGRTLSNAAMEDLHALLGL